MLLGVVRFGGRPAAGVTAVFATIFSVVGFEILSLGLHAKTYSWSRRFDADNRLLLSFYRRFHLEGGLLLGAGLVAAGAAILVAIVVEWIRSALLPLPHPEWASFAATLVIVGSQHHLLVPVHLGHVDDAAAGPRVSETGHRPWGPVDRRLAAVLVLVAAALWLPRLRGPLDLRYDAGVYYVLGTSLAEGRGYRLLNEPGAIEAVQYPPALPAIAAVHQRILGTSDPAVVGHALRYMAALLFLGYAVAVFALARRVLKPGLAWLAALLAILNPQVLFLSDSLHGGPALHGGVHLLSGRSARGGRGGARRPGLRAQDRRRRAARSVDVRKPASASLASGRRARMRRSGSGRRVADLRPPGHVERRVCPAGVRIPASRLPVL